MSPLVLRVLCVLAIGVFSSNAWSGHVLVLQPPEENGDGPNTHALIAELALAGFTVSVERQQSSSPPELPVLERLAARAGVVAAVAVERRGDAIVGQLWLHGARSVIVIEERAQQSVVSHSVVVLQLTERLLEFQNASANGEPDVESEQPAAPKAVAVEAPAALVPSSRDHAEVLTLEHSPGLAGLRPWVGIGADVSSLLPLVFWRFGVTTEVRISERVGVYVGAQFPLGVAQVNSDLGEVALTATDVTGGFLFDAYRRSTFSLGLGPRLGLRWLTARAEPDSEHDAQRASARLFTAGADLRATYGWDELQVGAVVGARLSTPEPRLTSQERDVTALGALSWSGSIWLGWELGL